MKRLRKLEGIVEDLSGQIEVESVRHPSSVGNSPEATREDHTPGARLSTVTPTGTPTASASGGADSPTPRLGPAEAKLPRPLSGTMSEPGPLSRQTSPDVHKQFGRLVLNDRGITRYVSSSLWSSINDEVSKEPPSLIVSAKY
jgi:hypothetical protein